MKLIICCFLFYIENLLNLRLSVYFLDKRNLLIRLQSYLLFSVLKCRIKENFLY